MSSTNVRGESFPVFEGTPDYVEGYVPSSFFDAPFSPLMRTATWVGMGLVLSVVCGLGALTFGLATMVEGSQTHATWYVWAGVILIVGCGGIGTALIKYGCREGRKFKLAHPELYGH
ncbi:MAG: hypothetical protein Q3972_09120 [Corynebacterium sp.]|nr:hypothetical protein [Corynebacterium sp.]